MKKLIFYILTFLVYQSVNAKSFKLESLKNVISMDVAQSGNILHLLSVTKNSKTELVYLKYVESVGWEKPIILATKDPVLETNMGNPARIAVYKDRIIAVWQTIGTGWGGRGPLRSTISHNNGRTWKSGPAPSDTGKDEDQGFVDIVADHLGLFHIVWLDKRGTKSKGLRYAFSKDEGLSWSKTSTIDKESCMCCWNRIYNHPLLGLFTLHRDAAPRDMVLSNYNKKNKVWDNLGYAGHFKWRFKGCPHIGGALTFEVAEGKNIVHSAVWTGADKHQGVYYLNFDLTNQKWSIPKRIGGDGAKYMDMLISGKHHLYFVWSEYVEDKMCLFVTESKDGGVTWANRYQISGLNNATYPRLVELNKKVYAIWRELDYLKLKPL